MRNLNLLKKTFLLFFIVSVSFQAFSQTMISQDPADYPAGTTFSNCPGGSCVISLPPARFNEDYTLTIPLTVPITTHTFMLSSIAGSCSEITNNHTLTNTLNLIDFKVTERCSPGTANSLSFTLNVDDGVNPVEQQDFIIPIIRDSVKLVLALDISGSMILPVQDGTGTRIDALKEAVYALVFKLEELKQGLGDSLSLTYFSSTVIDPDIPISKGFIVIDNDFTQWSWNEVYTDLDHRTPAGMAAVGEGLLNAKQKLKNDKSTDLKRIVFLFSDGLQDYGNKLKLDGVSFESTEDSLSNYSTNPKDSIIYITVTTAQAADIPPIMAAIAHNNNGLSLHVDGVTNEFTSFLDNQLIELLDGNNVDEVATRICGLTPFNDSTDIQTDANLTIEFNEDVAANSGNIVIYKASDDSEFETIDVLSDKVSGNSTSTITINPTNEFERGIEYYVLIDENAFEGVGGNSFAGITNKTYWSFTTEDIESPTVNITSISSGTINTSFDITVTFSEDVIGFTSSNITIANGTISNFTEQVASTIWTATITPTSDGTVTVDVLANEVNDIAGNGNTVSNQISIEYDNTNPTVDIESVSSGTINTSFDITVTFSEDVIGFTSSNITIANGTISNFTEQVASTIWTATITPTSDGTVTVDVLANEVNDIAGNLNEASAQLQITYQLSTKTSIIREDEFFVYAYQGSIIIDLFSDQLFTRKNGIVEVYSTNGILLSKITLNKSQNKIQLNTTTRLCIVKIIIDNKVYTKKLLVD